MNYEKEKLSEVPALIFIVDEFKFHYVQMKLKGDWEVNYGKGE